MSNTYNYYIIAPTHDLHLTFISYKISTERVISHIFVKYINFYHFRKKIMPIVGKYDEWCMNFTCTRDDFCNSIGDMQQIFISTSLKIQRVTSVRENQGESGNFTISYLNRDNQVKLTFLEKIREFHYESGKNQGISL